MPFTESPIDPDIHELVPNFCAARAHDLITLEKLLNEGDLSAVQRICHTVKGIARPYGFPTLEEHARNLEQAAKEQDLVRARSIFEEMRSYFLPFAPTDGSGTHAPGPETQH